MAGLMRSRPTLQSKQLCWKTLPTHFPDLKPIQIKDTQ